MAISLGNFSIGNFTAHSLRGYAPADLEMDREGRHYLKVRNTYPTWEIPQIKPVNARPVPQGYDTSNLFHLPKSLYYTCDAIEQWFAFDVLVVSAQFGYAALQNYYVSNQDFLDRLYKVVPVFPEKPGEGQTALKPCGVAGFEKLLRPLPPTFYQWQATTGQRISRAAAVNSVQYYGTGLGILQTEAEVKAFKWLKQSLN